MQPDRPDVALVAPYPPAGERHGGHSGVASYTANLANALAHSGARVSVVAPILADGDDRTFRDGDVTVRRHYRLGTAALPQAAAAVAQLGAGVVHLQWETFLYGGTAALGGLAPSLYGMRHHRAPLVTTMHQVLDPATIDRGTTELHRIGVPAPLARLGLGTVQRAITLASDLTVVHEAAFRRVLPEAVVVPHGVEESPPPDRTEARRRLGLDDRLHVLCFGFLAPYKGLELAAEAAAQAGPGVRVVFAGGHHPRLGDDGYRAELEARSAGRARFTGWVPDHEVADWFGAADLALFPYPKPFAASGALALALAYGTPLLVSPAMARCIGAPSSLAAAMHAAELASQLDRLATHADQLAELATWTGVLRRERGWPAVADRHLAVYAQARGEVSDGRDPAVGRLRAA